MANLVWQIRKTHRDVCECQDRLIDIIRNHKEKNTPLEKEESEIFYNLVSNAILSQIATVWTIKTPRGISKHFYSISEFAYFMARQTKSTVLIIDINENKDEVPISFLWDEMETMFIRYSFPRAQVEALQMSKESESEQNRDKQPAVKFNKQT